MNSIKASKIMEDVNGRSWPIASSRHITMGTVQRENYLNLGHIRNRCLIQMIMRPNCTTI